MNRDWCVPGALCTYHRYPRTVLKVDSAQFQFDGKLCVIARAFSPATGKKHGPQGMYAVEALRPYTEVHHAAY
jgi:hypothetical protein